MELGSSTKDSNLTKKYYSSILRFRENMKNWHDNQKKLAHRFEFFCHEYTFQDLGPITI